MNGCNRFGTRYRIRRARYIRLLGFDEPKPAAGRRTVALPSFPCRMLEEQLAERGQPGTDGLAFVNTRGNLPPASSFSSQSGKKARFAVGRPQLRWRHLGHTAVALAITEEAHPKAIQERMGHTSIAITLDRYGHLFAALGGQIADGLGTIYGRSAGAPSTPQPTAIGNSWLFLGPSADLSDRLCDAKIENSASQPRRAGVLGRGALPQKWHLNRGLEAAGGIEPPYGALQAPA